MVSLAKLSEVTEEGVKFQSPHDSTEKLLTPEESIRIQNSLGADIIMQLDDVVHSLTTGERVEEAMHRCEKVVFLPSIAIIYKFILDRFVGLIVVLLLIKDQRTKICFQ